MFFSKNILFGNVINNNHYRSNQKNKPFFFYLIKNVNVNKILIVS